MTKKGINLLPKELTVSDADLKRVSVLKKFTLLAFAIFILVVAGGLGTLVYFNRELDVLKNAQERLKVNIQSLEETEHKLVLTKERIAKIQNVLALRHNEEIFKKHKVILDNLPANLSLRGSDIDNGRSTLEVQALNSRDLINFMNSVLSRRDIDQLILGALSFSPFSGYKMSLEIY